MLPTINDAKLTATEFDTPQINSQRSLEFLLAMKYLSNMMTDHPHSMGETYFQHLRKALGFALQLSLISLICLIHAIIPCLFTRTGSRRLNDLHASMARQRNDVST